LARRTWTCKALVSLVNPASQVIIDQKEFQNLSQLKKLKEEYKKYYDSLKPLRTDIEYCAKLTDQCRQKLMTEFEQWYESIYGPQLSEQNRGADVCIVNEGCIGYRRKV
jgi:kinesin family protein 6/9